MTRRRQESPLGDSIKIKSISGKYKTVPSAYLFKRLNLSFAFLIPLIILHVITTSECSVTNDKIVKNDSNKNAYEDNIQDDLEEALRTVMPDFMEKGKVKEEYESYGRMYNNGTFKTGNSLWDGILNQCTVNPSVNCLQKNVYTYLEDSVGFNGDVNLTSGVCFKKNAVDYHQYSEEANQLYLKGSASDEVEENDGRANDEENEIDEDDEPETPLEEVTDSLYERSRRFLMTHDVRVTLPETLFHGATLRVSPRALTRTGALVHVELQPRSDAGTGRIFFKKIKKYFQKKLFMAALAIILVIKLIKLKLFFVLPLIVGVGAAKKLFLKFVLFIFPALSHIFKLCSWYHQNYHTTKFHHHHHLISHHHHKAPPVHHAPSGHGAHDGYAYGAHGGHGGHVAVQHEGSGPSFEHYPQDWELSGPGLGSEYLAAGIHRNAIATFKPHMNDVNDINSWGLGLPPGHASAGPSAGYIPAGHAASAVPTVASAATGYGSRTPLVVNAGRPVGPPSGPYMTRPRRPVGKEISGVQAEKEALMRAAALAARAPPSPVRDEVLRVSAAQLAEANRAHAEKRLVQHQQQILAATDPVSSCRALPSLLIERQMRAAALAARAPPSPVRDEVLRVSAAQLAEANRAHAEKRLVQHQQQILAATDPVSSCRALPSLLIERQMRAAALEARAPPSPVRDEVLRVSAAQLAEANRAHAEKRLVQHQQQILAATDPVSSCRALPSLLIERQMRAAALAARAPPSPVRDEVLRVSAAQLAEANRAHAEKRLVQHQQQILAATDPVSSCRALPSLLIERQMRAAALEARAPPSPVRNEVLRVSAAQLAEANRAHAEKRLVQHQQQILAATDPVSSCRALPSLLIERQMRAAALAARAPPSPVRDEVLRVSAAQLAEANRAHAEKRLVQHQQQILAATDPVSSCRALPSLLIERQMRAAALAARAPPSPVRDEVLRVSAAQLAEANRAHAEKRLVQHQQQILAATDPVSSCRALPSLLIERQMRAAALAARAPPSPVRDEVLRVSAAQLAEANRAHAEKRLVQHQQQILAATDPDTISADKFYGQLVEKVEKVLVPIGARDQGCRERAVCSLYRDPIQHTPYSNLVSNELSKDSSELQPPAGSQLALRYYRYVQAARDGQEQKDCRSLYPNCATDFHKK